MAGGKRRFGDRYDGRRLRSLNAFYRLIPYIMRSRVDAQNLYHDRIEIGRTEKFLQEKRRAAIKSISFLHVIIAAMVRTISQKPGLNRFIAGSRIYARNEILISLALKKELREGSPETTIKLKFGPADTLYDVVEKVNAAVERNKSLEESNSADKTAGIIMLCPGFVIRFMLWLIRALDSVGFMPRVINEISPFHTSVFITDVGSLGIKPIYHHLYEFGTTSIFVAFGIKQKEKIISRNNNIVEKRFVNIKIVTDERTVDGHYYASAFKLFKSLVQSPELLEQPPEKVAEDLC